MNRSYVVRISLLALIAASCSQGSQTGTQQGSNGGSTQSSSGGQTTTGNGGATNTQGGAPAQGGATTGNGGTTAGSANASGGSTANGGSANGGATANGGTTATGGSSQGGGTASGGTSNGSGGTATGSGGTATGSGGTATASGGTAAGGAGGVLDPATIVPDLNGFLWVGHCTGNVSVSGKNCPLYDMGTTCPNSNASSWDQRGTIRNQSFKVKGTAGTKYTINFEVRGVVGTRCYTGGTPASTATPNASAANNTWYVGGKQQGDSIWNTYELHVENPAVTGEANTYFFNAFPSNPDWCQKEATYEVKYTAKFAVMGDSTMRFTIHDTNCQAQQNCGSDEGAQTCTAPRTVDLTGMTPPPPSSFSQPPTDSVSGKTYNPQWLYIVVKSITSP